MSGSGFQRSVRITVACFGLSLGALLVAGCAELPEKPPHATHSSILGRAHFVAADGAVLPVRAWLPPINPPRAIVLGLHGFNDYSKAFESPGGYLRQRGIAVFAYDQRGFGNAPGRGIWAGTAAYVADLAAITDQLQHRYPDTPIYILGESMGAALAIVAMTREHPPRVDGLILSAPAVWARDLMPWYQRAVLALFAATLPELELTGSGLKIQASDNIEMLRGLGRDPLVIKSTRVAAVDGLSDLMDAAQAHACALNLPVLVLYGQRDEVIPLPPVVAMLNKLVNKPAVRMALYPEGYHLLLRDNKAQVPLGDMVAWINDHQAPLPSTYDQKLEYQPLPYR
jgi:alpha-beta hydrolase superfamily lysophospholipase